MAFSVTPYLLRLRGELICCEFVLLRALCLSPYGGLRSSGAARHVTMQKNFSALHGFALHVVHLYNKLKKLLSYDSRLLVVWSRNR